MRALFDASVCVLSARPLELQLRWRALVLPAVVATAAAIHAPSASAFSNDLRLEGAVAGPQAVRRVIEIEEEVVQPRRRAGRRKATSRRHGYRQGYRQVRGAGRARPRAVAPRVVERPRAVAAGPQLAAVNPTADIVPMEQRSLVANHPLLPDATLRDAAMGAAERQTAIAPMLGTEASSLRCRGTHASPWALAVATFAGTLGTTEPAMVAGVWPHCRGARNPQSSWRLASLGSVDRAPRALDADDEDDRKRSGWAIHWRASADCLAKPLRNALKLVADAFGPLTVNSTCRSRRHNARVGGAPRSYHLTGNAVDFRVRGRFREVHSFLSRMRSVGGLTHYGSGVFHIDTGPRRSWAPNSWGRNRVRGRRGRV